MQECAHTRASFRVFYKAPSDEPEIRTREEAAFFLSDFANFFVYLTKGASDKALRKELNTDAEVGIRAWWNKSVAPIILSKFGKDWEIDKGTLPLAIISALSRRGITVKNPVRLEKFSEYTKYINDTFRAGGRAAILAWRTSDWCAHWMGVERRNGRIRVMDPWEGRYMTFREATSPNVWDNFLVFGFVRR